MTVEELKRSGAIYVENIRDGLTAYDNEIVKLSGAEAEKCFCDKLCEYGPEGAFLDFYYFVLDDGARSRIDEQLTAEEQEFLGSMERLDGAFLFPAREELIRIAVKLNETEMLFSTFYFIEEEGKASTWWGNYGREYVVLKR